MIDYTVVQLIKDIKRRGSVPTNQALYTDQDFADTFTDCQEMMVIPAILKAREEFFAHQQDVTLVPGTLVYSLPERALGMKLRSVELLNAAGDVINHLPRVDPTAANAKSGYHFRANSIVLTREFTPSAATLRLTYYRRPNRLTLTSQCARITAINANVVTVDNIPTGFEAGTIVDIIAGRPPFDSRADSITITNRSGFLLTFDDASAFSIGDWICFEGETPIPQYPRELHQILVQYALVKLLSSLGDLTGEGSARADLDKLEENMNEYLNDRDDSAPQTLAVDNPLWANDYEDWY